MSLVIIVGIVLGIFTAAGRWATPKRERLPLQEWSLWDAYRNLVRGLDIWAPLQDRLPLH